MNEEFKRNLDIYLPMPPRFPLNFRSLESFKVECDDSKPGTEIKNNSFKTNISITPLTDGQIKTMLDKIMKDLGFN